MLRAPLVRSSAETCPRSAAGMSAVWDLYFNDLQSAIRLGLAAKVARLNPGAYPEMWPLTRRTQQVGEMLRGAG